MLGSLDIDFIKDKVNFLIKVVAPLALIVGCSMLAILVYPNKPALMLIGTATTVMLYTLIIIQLSRRTV